MAEETQVNPIQAEINALIAERDEIVAKQKELQQEFNQCDYRLCEINGAIQTLVKLFGKKENEDGDTEDKADAESSSNS